MMLSQDSAVAVFYMTAKKLEDACGSTYLEAISSKDTASDIVLKVNTMIGSLYDTDCCLRIGSDTLESIETMERAIDVARGVVKP